MITLVYKQVWESLFKSNLNYLDLSPFSKDPPFIYYSDSKNWVIDIIDNYEDDSGHRQTKPGYIFSFSSRLYLANDGIDNWYLAPSLILSSNNYQVQAVEKIMKISCIKTIFLKRKSLTLLI